MRDLLCHGSSLLDDNHFDKLEQYDNIPACLYQYVREHYGLLLYCRHHIPPRKEAGVGVRNLVRHRPGLPDDLNDFQQLHEFKQHNNVTAGIREHLLENCRILLNREARRCRVSNVLRYCSRLSHDFDYIE